MKLIRRKQWQARPPRAITWQGLPTEAFIHHSADATGLGYDTRAEQKAKMRDIQNFHMNDRGWSDIAYHRLVFRDGTVYAGRNVRHVPAAQEGHNTGTLAICLVGNGESETMTQAQKEAILKILDHHPSVKTLGGHRDASSTACPGARFYREISGLARRAGLRRYR